MNLKKLGLVLTAAAVGLPAVPVTAMAAGECFHPAAGLPHGALCAERDSDGERHTRLSSSC